MTSHQGSLGLDADMPWVSWRGALMGWAALSGTREEARLARMLFITSLIYQPP